MHTHLLQYLQLAVDPEGKAGVGEEAVWQHLRHSAVPPKGGEWQHGRGVRYSTASSGGGSRALPQAAA